MHLIKDYFFTWLRRGTPVTPVMPRVELSDAFVSIFDDESYIKANLDVVNLIEAGRYESVIDHFSSVGYWEVKTGSRRIGKEFPYFDAGVYTKFNPDFPFLTSSERAYEHFINYGYGIFKSGVQVICGYYPLMSSQVAVRNIEQHFDEKSYLQANPDVRVALKGKKISSAWEHFKKYGIFEAQKQGRPVSPVVGSLTEPEYLLHLPELDRYLREGSITSPFEHFLCTGLPEVVDGKRLIQPYGGYLYRRPLFSPESGDTLKCLPHKYLISLLISGFDLDLRWLQNTIRSIERQWYDYWEVCIACDEKVKSSVLAALSSIDPKKVKVVSLKSLRTNPTSLNEALLVAEGEYITCLTSRDELAPDALYEVAKVINKGAEFIFSDEDCLNDDGQHIDPIFKPDFTPDRLMSYNFIGHLFVIKRSLVNLVRGWSVELSGAENYDLFLKIHELTDKVQHIPKILYHSRVTNTSKVSHNDLCRKKAGLMAIEHALTRRDRSGEVEIGVISNTYRVHYHISATPLVSIIILQSGNSEQFRQCIEAVLNITKYRNIEIIGVITSSNKYEITTDEVLHIEGLDNRVRLFKLNAPNNVSLLKNYAAFKLSRGKFLVFMHSRLEVITSRWIEEMLMHSQKDSVGCVSTLLLNENGTINHSGYVLTSEVQNLVISVFSGFPKRLICYTPGLSGVCNYSAMTADLLMIRKDLFKSIDGFSKEFSISLYRDVDLCLRVKAKGVHNVYTPFAEAILREPLQDEEFKPSSVECLERTAGEAKRLRDLNSLQFDTYDSCYNPNLDVVDGSCRIAPHVSRLYESFIGRTYEEKVIKSFDLGGGGKNRVCIFSHYDKDHQIDNYVLFYLSELSRFYDIVFVTTSELISDKELKKAAPFCVSYIVKANEGYDFGAWKTGLDYISSTLNGYDFLLLCNDSVYGPMQELGVIIDKMESVGYDVWSLSDSYELSHHLQSYFVQYSKKAFFSKIFQNFWEGFLIYDDKLSLIKNYEVDYSVRLIKSETLVVGAYYSMSNKSNLNSLQYYCSDLLKDNFPFLKVEVLRDNPMGFDLTDFEGVIESTGYDTRLIKKHLSRFS